MSNWLRFSFSFSHHGNYSSFHRLLHFAKGRDVCVDATPSICRRFPQRIARALEWRYLRWMEKIAWKKARKHGCDVIHYLYPENTFYRGQQFRGNQKIVISCHQPAEFVRENIDRPLLSCLKRALAAADVVTVLGSDELSLYQELAPHAKVVFIPHGIDTEWFRYLPFTKRTRSAEKQVILTVGNWLRDYTMWANVINIWAKNGWEAEFKVLAKTDVLEKALELLTPAGKALVNVLPRISDEELKELYYTSDVHFLPLEAAMANNALLESMSCGLPVITTDLSGTRVYTQDSVQFFSSSEPNVASKELRKFVDEVQMQEKSSGRAYQHVEAALSWHQVVIAYHELYE